MKVIRAERNIFVPNDPENPDYRSVRLVQAGLVALVPEDFNLPDGAISDVEQGEDQQGVRKKRGRPRKVE